MIYALVFIGGVAGALARYYVDGFVKEEVGSALPWGTLTVNLIGASILGVLMGILNKGGLSTDTLALLGTGFCGALTTFSSFSLDTYKLFETGSVGKACANVVVTFVLGVLCIFGAYAFTVAVI